MTSDAATNGAGAGPRVWLVTGCSTGFGRELALQLARRGDVVVATARNEQSVADLRAAGTVLPLRLDVTEPREIEAAVARVQAEHGRIDVLVNNAGYGYQSAIEEGVEDEIRAQFDANVFGLFALTRTVLPIMRAQRRGHVINVTSVAGLVGFAGSGYYAASKHAIEGWSDSLAVEAAPLGIKVTCVEPGPFRTDWAGRSLRQTPNRIADYADTAGARLRSTADVSGKQAGDPVRAVHAMIALVEQSDPPRHLVLGRWGFDQVTAKLRERLGAIEAARDVALGADYPDA